MQKAKQTKEVEAQVANNLEDQTENQEVAVKVVTAQKERPEKLVASPSTDPTRYGGLLTQPNEPAPIIVTAEEQPEEFKQKTLEPRIFTTETPADRYARAALGR